MLDKIDLFIIKIFNFLLDHWTFWFFGPLYTILFVIYLFLSFLLHCICRFIDCIFGERYE